MGYRIDYAPASRQHPEVRFRYLRRILLSVFCFVLFTFLCRSFLPGSWNLLVRIFVPGEPAVTTQAVKHLLLQIRAGDSISDAVRVFCLTVINNGYSS